MPSLTPNPTESEDGITPWFHEWPDLPGTAVDTDVRTIEQVEAEWLAKARRINPSFGLAPGGKSKRGRKPGQAGTKREMRTVNGVTEYRCVRCRGFFEKDGFWRKTKDRHGIQSRCKKCIKECDGERFNKRKLKAAAFLRELEQVA